MNAKQYELKRQMITTKKNTVKIPPEQHWFEFDFFSACHEIKFVKL